MRISVWACPLVLVLMVLAPGPVVSADVAKDFKSKDYKKRLKAVAAVRKDGGEGAERLLITALRDPDWEVVERAAAALVDHGGEKAIKPLVDLASKGPVRRVRLVAAQTLTKLGIEPAAKRLAKRLKRDEAVNTADALVVLAHASEGPVPKDLLKGITKAFKHKEAPVRAAIAGALVALPPDDRVKQFEKQLEDEELTVVAAALDSSRARPEMVYLPAMLERLNVPNVNDVIGRRVLAAVEAIFLVADDAQKDVALGKIDELIDEAKDNPGCAMRIARLLGNLASVPPKPEEEADEKKDESKEGETKEDKRSDEEKARHRLKVAPDKVLALLEKLLKHEDEAPRAEAVRSLRRIGTKESIDRAEPMAKDPHARVRFQTLQALVAGRSLDHDATFELVVDRLANDEDASVREEAALLLGRPGPENAPFAKPVGPLADALKDKVWSVAVVAAVSLGKTRCPDAVKPLAALLNRKTTKDWRLRGAAVVGLGKMRHKDAVTPLILALKDRDEWVARNAFEFLKRMTKRNIAADFQEWTDWWSFNKEGYEFIDREKLAKELKKGGYAVDPVDVYDRGKGALDVVVLQSRGDHIEQLLENLGIEYRLTRAAQVEKANVHSFAVFVTNCTGEIQKTDVERLQWFTRVGGYLFCSCWALHHTIEKVYPGLVRKLPTRAEVLDNVVSMPCPCDSPFLEEVFKPWSQAIYVLFGSHLIEVLQYERVEVLIDSPQAAARWGGGNMAAWFPAGHGVILDSANHFDLQGLERVSGLKKAQDRMAYAMDHMGLDYEELRKHAASKIWDRQAQAVKLVRDLSAFRFITNFVRQKRKVDP